MSKTKNFAIITSYKFYFNISENYNSIFEKTHLVWEALSLLPLFLRKHIKKDKNNKNSFIDPTAKVHPTAIIKNSYIGPEARIYEGVVVRDSLIGKQTVIGHCSEIARSIILDRASIPRFDYIGASIIGNNTRFGGMVACASRRIDNKRIIIRIKGQVYQTGLQKLGSIIGDNSHIGFSVHCNPGALIGSNTIIMPQVEIAGVVPANSIVVAKQDIRIIKRYSLTDLQTIFE